MALGYNSPINPWSIDPAERLAYLTSRSGGMSTNPANASGTPSASLYRAPNGGLYSKSNASPSNASPSNAGKTSNAIIRRATTTKQPTSTALAPISPYVGTGGVANYTPSGGTPATANDFEGLSGTSTAQQNKKTSGSSSASEITQQDRRQTTTSLRSSNSTTTTSGQKTSTTSSVTDLMDPATRAAYESTLYMLQSGGTAAQRQGNAGLQAILNNVTGALKGFTTDAARAQAQRSMGLYSQQLREEMLPQVDRAIEGAGLSGDALGTILQQDMTARVARQAADSELNAIVDYANISNGLRNTGLGAASSLASDPVAGQLVAILEIGKGSMITENSTTTDSWNEISNTNSLETLQEDIMETTRGRTDKTAQYNENEAINSSETISPLEAQALREQLAGAANTNSLFGLNQALLEEQLYGAYNDRLLSVAEENRKRKEAEDALTLGQAQAALYEAQAAKTYNGMDLDQAQSALYNAQAAKTYNDMDLNQAQSALYDAQAAKTYNDMDLANEKTAALSRLTSNSASSLPRATSVGPTTPSRWTPAGYQDGFDYSPEAIVALLQQQQQQQQASKSPTSPDSRFPTLDARQSRMDELARYF